MSLHERDIVERAVHSISEQAANTSKVVDEAMEAGLTPPITPSRWQRRCSA